MDFYSMVNWVVVVILFLVGIWLVRWWCRCFVIDVGLSWISVVFFGNKIYFYNLSVEQIVVK